MSLLTYRDIMAIPTFEGRFDALHDVVLANYVDEDSRRIKQTLYASDEWKEVRDFVVARDGGKDLGYTGSDILGAVYVHHTIPVTSEMIRRRDPKLLDPNYLISASKGVHEALHTSNRDLIPKDQYVERKPNDTIPWR